MDLETLLKEERLNIVSKKEKEFILEFTKGIRPMDYDFDGDIRNGFEWGNYQIIYTLKGMHNSRSIMARILIRDNCSIISGGKEIKFNKGIALRLYFSNINKHIDFIENAPNHIKERFINDYGKCKYCTEQCYKRKIYTINNKEMVKCRDAFEYNDPKIKDLKDYINILKEFYGKKENKRQ